MSNLNKKQKENNKLIKKKDNVFVRRDVKPIEHLFRCVVTSYTPVTLPIGSRKCLK